MTPPNFKKCELVRLAFTEIGGYVKAVSGRRTEADFGLAYYRTCGSVTMTSGGRKEKGIELEGKGNEMRGRPVLESILKLGNQPRDTWL